MGGSAGNLSILAAFAAGLLSFISPCVAPLMPGYLSLISGASVGQVSAVPGGEGAAGRVLRTSLYFVAGFTLVFVVLGASASAVGGLLAEHRVLLNRVAGGIMILMGLFVAGALRLPWLYRERRFHPDVKVNAQRTLTRSETMLLGMAFGFGWTPCIGPLLGSILIYTSTADTVQRGTLLLLAYSIGLGVPFVALGLGVGRILGAIRWVTRHYGVVSALSGATLVVLGVLFLTDRFLYFNIAAQRFFTDVFVPVSGKVGL